MNLEEAKANIGKQFNYINKSGEMIYSNMTLRSVKHTGGSGLANISYEPNDNSVFTVGVEGLELSEQGMNLEEAKANIGREVIYIGNDQEVIIAFNGKKLIISYPTKNTKTSVLIEYDELCFWNVDPQDLKLKEQPMQNYKIQVTPETSEEVQELFFELGYSLIKDHYYHPSMDYLLISKNFISYSNSLISFNECEYQEITLPQLRDLVVLKRNDMNDATHGAHFSYERFYISENCTKEYADEKWVNKVSHAMPVPLSELEEPFKEMTWQDALHAVADGKDVEVKNISWFDANDLKLGQLKRGKDFRLKPKTIHIDGGDYTKEELLKIVGEMG